MGSKLKYIFLLLIIAQKSLSQQDTVMLNDSVSDPYDSYTEETSSINSTEQYNYFLDRDGETDPINKREISDSLVKKMQADDEFWYANAEIKKPEQKQKANKRSLFRQPWFQALLWITIIAGFAGFLILYLAGSNVGLFRKKKRAVDENMAETELSTEDLFAINYQREIDKAILQGNHRLATRLLFLRLLKNLSENNIIEYKQGKTNLDYLIQLQATRYYPDFFRITRNYEYSWYGQFDVTEEKFALIKKDFDQFEKRFYH
jgi:hypothetical protein